MRTIYLLERIKDSYDWPKGAKDMGRPAVCRLACSRNNACEILGVC